MSNLPQGTASNVLVGPARFLIAPAGSTLPTLDGTQNPVVWPGAWVEVGYTAAGTTLAYNPSFKEINVDEEQAAVKEILDGEKATISLTLAEATLENMAQVISAATITQGAADATHAQIATLDVGSGTPIEVMVGLEGKSPQGLQRIIVGYRAVASGNVSATFRRNTETTFLGEWKLLADATKVVGKRLYKIVDFKAPHS
jgi:hypothetical protein